MKNKKLQQKAESFTFFFLVFSFSLSLFPLSAAAQISGLEFLNIPADAKIGDVIAALYVYGVGFVALAAFIVFTAGGVQYIFAGDKDPSKAKEWMWNAFWGLVLALTSWLILYTINPALVKNVGDLGLQKINITPNSEGAVCVVGSANPAEQCTTGFDCVNGKCQKPSGTLGRNQPCVKGSTNPSEQCQDGLTCTTILGRFPRCT